MQYKIGQLIKCSNKDDMVRQSEELAAADVFTEFIYEHDGKEGSWLEIVGIGWNWLDDPKARMCDDYCRFTAGDTKVKDIERICAECPLKELN